MHKELIYPDGRTVRYTYDEMDRMKTVTDWADRVTTYTWDAGGRLRRVDRPNKTARVLSYDDAGRLTRADELLPGETKGGVFPTAQYTFVLPTTPSGPLGWWKPNVGVYSVSPSGWWPSFPQQLVPPHLANRPVYRRLGSYWPGINSFIPSPAGGYNLGGTPLPVLSAGEGAWIETRLSNISQVFNGTSWQTGQWLSERSLWEYWIAGYATQAPTPSPLQPGRLISSRVFAYDAAGRVQKSFRLPQPHPLPSSPMTGASYDGDNRFLGCTEHPAALWAHDTDGNLTQGLLPAVGAAAPATADFTWDVRNRLTILVNTTTAEQHHYRYDPEGNRVESRQPWSYYGYPPSNGPLNVNNPPPPPVLISGVRTSRRAISAHGPGGLSRVLVSWNNDGGGDRYYVHGLGLLYDSNGLGGAQEDLNYYHYDHQGNTTAITGAPPYALTDTVSIKARWEYDPYGAVTHYESPGWQVRTPYLYGGEHGVMTDAATGFLHMRARYYHPYLKRFISADPIGFEGGMNWFAYADGDPLMKNDPKGEAVPLVVWGVLALWALGTDTANAPGPGDPIYPSSGAGRMLAVGGAAATGSVGAAAISTAAPAAVNGLVAGGMSQAAASNAVTWGVLGAGVIGGVQTYRNTSAAWQAGDMDTVALNSITLLSGLSYGVNGGGRGMAEGMMGKPSPAPNTWNPITVLKYELSAGYKPNYPGGSVSSWMSSAPTPASGGAAAAFFASGVGSTIIRK